MRIIRIKYKLGD